MIVVLDTNVLVSGVLKPYSPAASILRMVVEGAIQPAYDLRILAEYREVLSRPKFNFGREIVDPLLAQIEEEGFLFSASPLKSHLPDPADEPFLEVALAVGAVALVTGNKRHFPRGAYGAVKISSPSEFLEMFRLRPH
jgi:putative PIN family toxin of toxin-antitoxin system